MYRIVAPVKGGDGGGIERIGIGDAGAVAGAERRMLRQQTEADEQVGFAAAHRLFQVEDRLRRMTGEARHPFADQVLHTLGHVGALEEGDAIAFVTDQFVELFDLVAHPDGEGVRLQGAGVTNGFHCRSSCHSTNTNSYGSKRVRRLIM